MPNRGRRNVVQKITQVAQVPVHPPIPAVPVVAPIAAPPPVVIQFIQGTSVKAKDVPMFHVDQVEDVVDWYTNLDQVVAYHQWSLEQTLRNVGMALEGEARKGFLTLSPKPEPHWSTSSVEP